MTGRARTCADGLTVAKLAEPVTLALTGARGANVEGCALEASLYLIYPEYLPILNYRQQSGKNHGTRNSFYCTML